MFRLVQVTEVTDRHPNRSWYGSVLPNALGESTEGWDYRNLHVFPGVPNKEQGRARFYLCKRKVGGLLFVYCAYRQEWFWDLVATIHFSPFTCCFCRFLRRSFTGSFRSENAEFTTITLMFTIHFPNSRANVGACAMRTKLLDNKKVHIQNFIVMAFPMKNSILDNFPLCPPAPPPKTQILFYCRLAFL